MDGKTEFLGGWMWWKRIHDGRDVRPDAAGKLGLGSRWGAGRVLPLLHVLLVSTLAVPLAWPNGQIATFSDIRR